MKKILSIFVIILLAVIMVSCGKDKEPENNGELVDLSESNQKKVRIKVWLDAEPQYMEALIEAFNVEYPNIIVDFTKKGTVDIQGQLELMGPSGQGADVIQLPHDHLGDSLAKDLLLRLNSETSSLIETRSSTLGKDVAYLKDKSGVEGYYGVPMSAESVVLFYNKDLVSENNLPTTFESLVEKAQVWNSIVETNGLTHLQAGNPYFTSSSHFADSYFMQFIYSAFGFYPFGANGDDASQVGFQNATPALNWIRNTLQPISMAAGGKHDEQKSAAFEEGKIPFILGGPWNISTYQDKNLNFGALKIPTIGGNETRTFAGAQLGCVYKLSRHQEEAQTFLRFLLSDTAMQIMYEKVGKLPALTPTLLQGISGINSDALLLVISQQLETSIPMPYIPEVQSYWGPGETMLTSLWDNPSSIVTDLVTIAENAYKTNVGLGN